MNDGNVEPRYTVTHKDGKPLPPGTRLFVLSPDTDPYAGPTLCFYAQVCRLTHPELSKSIVETYELPCAFVTETPPTYLRTPPVDPLCTCGHNRSRHHEGDGVDSCDCGRCDVCPCAQYKKGNKTNGNG